MKQEPLPPGVYTMTIDRVRKVRNKDQKRIHMTIVDGPHSGRKLSETIRPEPEEG